MKDSDRDYGLNFSHLIKLKVTYYYLYTRIIYPQLFEI